MATTHEPTGSRRYSDRELALILKSAAELQERAPSAAEGRGQGYTLAELQDIAAQVGISPELVREAAAALDTGIPVEGGSGFFGAPTVFELERTVQGEVPEGELGELVEGIRRIMRYPGRVTHVERSLQWTLGGGSSDLSTLHIGVTVRRGYTRVRLLGRYDDGAGLFFVLSTFFGGLGGVGLAAGLSLAAAPFVAVAGAVAGGTYMLCRGTYRPIARRIERRLRAQFEQIVAEVERMVREAGASDRGAVL